jgi:hypothetical protein
MLKLTFLTTTHSSHAETDFLTITHFSHAKTNFLTMTRSSHAKNLLIDHDTLRVCHLKAVRGPNGIIADDVKFVLNHATFHGTGSHL